MMLIRGLIFCSLISFSCFGENIIDSGVYRLLSWDENRDTADTISDFGQVALVASPIALSFYSDNRDKNLKTTGIALGANYSVNLISKLVTDRQRPNKKNDKSFWSGHVSTAFLSATLSCNMSKKFCIPTYFLATGVLYFRIASANHWLTDCIVGAYIGIINGVAMPTIIGRW